MTASPQAGTASVRLPAVMDLRAAGPLAAQLLALRGRAVSLDASGVERLGGLGLQVLLSARLSWRIEGLDFALASPSEAFQTDCALLGARMFEDFEVADHG